MKTVVKWILIIFGVYTIFTRPELAADIVRSTAGLLLEGFLAVQTFFDALLRG